MLRLLVAAVTIAYTIAKCDNACSGHGSCQINGICDCYDNWGIGLYHDSGDCSERVCPYEFAWVDTPTASGYHHKYVECAAKGTCNRDSGECECFPGYEGKACQRTACPNDCSGHGRCMFIEDLPYGATVGDYDAAQGLKSDKPLSASPNYIEVGTGEFGVVDPHTFTYYQWDGMRTRGCLCDATYGDIDCSKKMCQYGTDVMDLMDDSTSSEYGNRQIQQLVFRAENLLATAEITETTSIADRSGIDGKTFSLTFKSKLNETYTTIPIVMQAEASSSDNPTHFKTFVDAVESALKSLPNNVIDDVVVTGRLDSGTSNADGSAYVSTTAEYDAALLSSMSANTDTQNYVVLNVTFSGNNVQGPQHFLTINAISCGDGCTPKQNGLELVADSMTVTEAQASVFNSYECGRRGKCDYTTGTCTCYAGYSGLSCNTITALV